MRFQAESEKPRQRVSNADQKVLAHPESFCWLARWMLGILINYWDNPKNIQMVSGVPR